MNKYYFITYITRRLGKQFLDSDVINEHPFDWLKTAQSESNNKIVLVGWKEISKEEYNLYDTSGRDKDHTQTGTFQGNLNRSEDQDPFNFEGLKS